MTLRGLVKKELKARGYVTEVSTTGLRHFGTRGIGYRHITTKGIRLDRRIYKRGGAYDYTEYLEACTMGCISEEELTEVIEKCIAEYKAPYRTDVSYIVMDTSEDYLS